MVGLAPVARSWRARLSLSPSLSVTRAPKRTNTGIPRLIYPRRALHSVRSTLTRSAPCRVPAPADHSHAASAVVMCAVLFACRCAPQKGLRISVRTRGCSGNAFHLEYANVSNTPPTRAALRGHDRRASAWSPRVPRMARKDVCQEFIGRIHSRNNPCCPTKLALQQLAQTTICSSWRSSLDAVPIVVGMHMAGISHRLLLVLNKPRRWPHRVRVQPAATM
jgi:hypothetical protein